MPFELTNISEFVYGRCEVVENKNTPRTDCAKRKSNGVGGGKFRWNDVILFPCVTYIEEICHESAIAVLSYKKELSFPIKYPQNVLNFARQDSSTPDLYPSWISPSEEPIFHSTAVQFLDFSSACFFASSFANERSFLVVIATFIKSSFLLINSCCKKPLSAVVLKVSVNHNHRHVDWAVQLLLYLQIHHNRWHGGREILPPSPVHWEEV